jgi:hypothetical protein
MVSVTETETSKDEKYSHVDLSKTSIKKEISASYSKDVEFLKLILRIIQLMVEGQNREIQDFLRDQDAVQPS